MIVPFLRGSKKGQILVIYYDFCRQILDGFCQQNMLEYKEVDKIFKYF
jgi:hypothetical protein